MTKNNLNDFEWTICWMAIRYAMNRQTISSATLPAEIIKNFYHRLSDNQKDMIVMDLKKHFELLNSFDVAKIDRTRWLKFMSALDYKNHFDVVLIDDTIVKVFKANNRIYLLDNYIKSPYHEIFIYEENIKNKINK